MLLLLLYLEHDVDVELFLVRLVLGRNVEHCFILIVIESDYVLLLSTSTPPGFDSTLPRKLGLLHNQVGVRDVVVFLVPEGRSLYLFESNAMLHFLP